MTSVEQLERVKALVDRLLPLAARARGEIISAADWNIVVGALIEVARSVVDDGGVRAVPPHDHPDQVNAGWLDPRLRAAIERGPLADPVATARLGGIERGVSAAERRIDAVLSDLREIRVTATRIESSDLDRQSTITRLTRKVDGVADARDDVSALRDSLDVLRTDINAVSAFANGFSGVSPADVLEGLRRADDLRTRLTTTAGTILDVSEIERRLAVFSNTVVTEDELTTQLGDLRLQVPDDVRASLTEQARTAAQQQVDSVVSTVADELRADITDRLAAVETLATQRATEVAGRLGESLRADLRDSLTQELTAVIGAQAEGIRTEVNAAITDIRASTRAMADAVVVKVDDVVTERLADQMGAAEQRLTDQVLQRIQPTLNEFAAAVTGLRGQLSEQVQANRALATSVAELRETTTAATDSLRRDLQDGFTRDLRAGMADLSRRITEQNDGLRAEIATERRRIDVVDTSVVDLRNRPIILRRPE